MTRKALILQCDFIAAGVWGPGAKRGERNEKREPGLLTPHFSSLTPPSEGRSRADPSYPGIARWSTELLSTQRSERTGLRFVLNRVPLCAQTAFRFREQH